MKKIMRVKQHSSSIAVPCEECRIPTKIRYDTKDGRICEECARVLHPELFIMIEKRCNQKESLFD